MEYRLASRLDYLLVIAAVSRSRHDPCRVVLSKKRLALRKRVRRADLQARLDDEFHRTEAVSNRHQARTTQIHVLKVIRAWLGINRRSWVCPLLSVGILQAAVLVGMREQRSILRTRAVHRQALGV